MISISIIIILALIVCYLIQSVLQFNPTTKTVLLIMVLVGIVLMLLDYVIPHKVV